MTISILKIINAVNYKAFAIFIIFLTVFSCKNEGSMIADNLNKRIVERAELLSKENVFFWLGHYGMVVPEISAARRIENNYLFRKGDIIFHGSNFKITEAVIIFDKIKTKKISIEDALKVNTGILVVFTPEKIFVLNFERNEFGWYERFRGRFNPKRLSEQFAYRFDVNSL